MTISLPKPRLSFLVPAGMHSAVCYIVAELGSQESSFGTKPSVHISWELPEEKMDDGRPAVVGRRYTLSTGPKAALRADLEGWLGRDLTNEDIDALDLADFVGKPCQLNIRHSAGQGDRVFANVVSVLPAAKGSPKKVPTYNGPVAFSLSDRPFDRGSYEALPGWLQDVIAKSPEYRAATNPGNKALDERLETAGFTRGAAAMADEELPF